MRNNEGRMHGMGKAHLFLFILGREGMILAAKKKRRATKVCEQKIKNVPSLTYANVMNDRFLVVEV